MLCVCVYVVVVVGGATPLRSRPHVTLGAVYEAGIECTLRHQTNEDANKHTWEPLLTK